MLVGKSHWEHLLIKVVISIFTYTGLGCLIYFVLAAAIGGVGGIAHPFSIFVEVVGLIEILWYFAWFLPFKAYLQKPGYKAPPLNREQRKTILRRALEHVPDVEQFMRKWSLNAHMEDIRRENVKDWLLWALFDRNGSPGNDNVELEDYITETEEKTDFRIKPGRGEAETLLLSFDAIPMTHRSLLYYMTVGFIDFATTMALFSMGFTFYRQPRAAFLKSFPFRPMTLIAPRESAAPGFSYFYRPHQSTTHRPILLLHGVGVGLMPYLFWLTTVPKDVGVLAIELLPISNRITTQMPTAAEIADGIAAIRAQQAPAFDDFVLIGHSYGTLLVAPLLRHPQVSPHVSRVVLMDPVALLLHLPDVAYNFTRRKPRWGNELEISWAAGTDPLIAHTIARRLCWRESIIWKEDLEDEFISRRTTVVLGSRDCVTNPCAVASYTYFGDVNFSSADIDEWKTTAERWSGQVELELLWLDGLDHGQVIFSPKWLRVLKRTVDEYCLKSGTKEVEVGYSAGGSDRPAGMI